MKRIDLNLSTLDNGSIQEKFEYEMEQVMKNIMDLNTEVSKKRQVTLTIDIETDDKREMLFLSASSKSKLAPRISTSTKILFGRGDDGYLEARELKSGVQGQTYFDPEDGKLKTDVGQPIEEIEKEENDVIKFKKKG